MKVAHNVKLSVFSHEEEDSEQIKQKFLELVPFDLEQENLELKTRNAQGVQEKKIMIYELNLTKERHTKRFMEHLKSNLDKDQIGLLKKQAESRLDQELNFFIRLDKPNLLQDNKLLITDAGNCFHIKISVAAYPANRENGLKVINEWLD
ncbi:RNA-binding domain-containing protein [Nanoarchaeota archaeon]